MRNYYFIGRRLRIFIIYRYFSLDLLISYNVLIEWWSEDIAEIE